MISSFLSKLGSQNNRGESWSKGFYFLGIVFIIFGLSYLAVPLYRIYCQITGYGGTIKTFNIGEITTKTTETHSIDSQNLKSPLYREITVRFNADLNENLPWIFKPAANEVKIIVGEGAAPTLTFYSLTNLSDQPAIGVATYNVTPAKAAIYFNKIQCFCLRAIVA
jgi:cytochrome c oxidase assembly protein subunit 11